MSNIHDYWSISPEEQKMVKRQLDHDTLQVMAYEQGLLIHEGKLIKPSEYPCECELQSPYDCWQDKHPDASDLEPLEDETRRVCTCACHTYWTPF